MEDFSPVRDPTILMEIRMRRVGDASSGLSDHVVPAQLLHLLNAIRVRLTVSCRASQSCPAGSPAAGGSSAAGSEICCA